MAKELVIGLLAQWAVDGIVKLGNPQSDLFGYLVGQERAKLSLTMRDESAHHELSVQSKSIDMMVGVVFLEAKFANQRSIDIAHLVSRH